MKNITFFDHMKCIVRNDCSPIENQKAEIKKQGSSLMGELAKPINTENVKQDTVSKLNVYLFDIDQVFAN
ncbi:hypothetical protein [Flavobacterium sp.]|uniref:hypothetical protein n=1 Tax=Flavobacterium sp. TaxID=239 RepID=UPI00391A4708